MRWLNAARARLDLLLRGDASEKRMREELSFHVEMETERLIQSGHPPAEAHRLARLALGGEDRYQEELRDGRGLGWITGLGLDLKLGGRMLRKYPGLTAVACVALAVAIGSGAAYLELVSNLFHPSLPFAGGDRVVGIYSWDPQRGAADHRVAHELQSWRTQLRSVEHLGAFTEIERSLITPDGRRDPIRGAEVSASVFQITGATPLIGRTFSADDEREGGAAVAVIGEDVWRSRFGSDPAILGRTIQLGTSSHIVVGVLPESYGFPGSVSMWVPLRLSAAGYEPGAGPALRLVARLVRGTSLEDAQTELTAVAARSAAARAGTTAASEGTGGALVPVVKPFVESIWASQQDGVMEMRILYSVNLFFIFLLLLCGANVATLVFARTTTRESELTVRTALGAGRVRIMAQLFAEALVLTTAAALLGLAAAALVLRWVLGLFTSLAAVKPPFWWDATLSAQTITYAAALTIVAALIVGGVPAWKATGPQLQARLRNAGDATAGMKFGGVWTGVIVTQVALTVIFLASVVSLALNVRNNRSMSASAFPLADYVAGRVGFDRDSSGYDAKFASAYSALEQQLRGVPGVVEVTYGSRLPGMTHPSREFELENARPEEYDNTDGVRVAHVAYDFLEAFGGTIRSGRGMDARDVEFGRKVMVVDQTFVNLSLRGQDPTGRRIRLKDPQTGEPGEWHEVIGVVSDLTASENRTAGDALMYLPVSPSQAGEPVHLAVRVAGDAAGLATQIAGVAATVSPALRVDRVRPMAEIDRARRAGMRYLMRALAIGGVVALLLATAGVYSLMAFNAARRTREIGIRAALGASPRLILKGTFSRALLQVGIGVLAGSVPGAALVAFGAPEVARGSGPAAAIVTFAALAAFMMSVGLLATLVPAWRALGVQPTEALRGG